MRKAYQLVVALGVAAASLTSCSRGSYAVNQYAAPAATTLEQAALPTSPANLETMARVAVPATALRSVKTAPSIATAPSDRQISSAATHAAQTVHPTLVQHLILKKVAKQVAKMQATRQNTAHAEHTASNVRSSLFILLAGLVVILIGGLIGGANVVVTIGGIIFVVGLILLVIALIDG